MSEATITRVSISKQIAKLINGKAWVGGDKVRVYLGKGYVEIGQSGCDARRLNNHNAYTLIREAGLEYFTLGGEASPPKSQPATNRGRTACLNCGIAPSMLVEGYCTDCHGERTK